MTCISYKTSRIRYKVPDGHVTKRRDFGTKRKHCKNCQEIGTFRKHRFLQEEEAPVKRTDILTFLPVVQNVANI